jgi:hypothetical protein
MDPLTALGLAANILQFIDFSWTLVNSAKEVYGSKTGATRENSDLTNTISRLDDVTTELGTPASLDPQQQSLCMLSAQCQILSKELRDILVSLTARPDSKVGSARVAWKSWRKKDKITSLRGRLNEYRNQILLELAILLK